MWLLWRPVSVYSRNRGRFHHLVFVFRGLLWLTAAIFAVGQADDRFIWLAIFVLAGLGAVAWRKLDTLEVLNQILIVVDLTLISVAIHLDGGLASQAYILYGGEALFLTAYGTIRYSLLGVAAYILSYGLATAAWDVRLFWWRNIILGLYFLAAGGLGEEYRRTRGQSRENYLVIQQLSRLRALQESIVEEQDIDIVLKRLLAEAREVTHATAAYIVQFERNRMVNLVVDGFSFPDNLEELAGSARPEAFQVIGEHDGEQWWSSPIGQHLKQAGAKSLALMPLKREDTFYGWMGLATDRGHEVLAAQQFVIQSLSDMISTQLKFHESQTIAAKRGNLLGILEHVGRIINRNLEMEQLLRSLRQAVAEVLEIDSFFVALTLPDDPTHALMQYVWDDGKEYPAEIIPLDPDGPTGRCIITGESLRLGEHDFKGSLAGSFREPRGMMFIPLIHEGRVLGALSAQSYRIEYDPDHLEFLSAIASQAAIAIRNAQMYQQTQEIALTDYLTGMGNSRRFNLALQSALEQAEEKQQPLSLLLLDSDSLKSINDRFGHRAGDLYLQKLAQIIRENVREGDMAFRYAGDEFVVVLPNTDIIDAAQIGERIRYAIEGSRFQWSESPVFASTISVGVANFQPGMSPDALFQAADRAMYLAKQQGKNRVAQAQ